MHEDRLKRFHDAQNGVYETALKEIAEGRKRSHWMWFIFPQIAGLGFSDVSRFYAIRDLHEAESYLEDVVLTRRLVSICKVLLTHDDKTAYDIFGSPDDMKLRSSMTLFCSVGSTLPIFQQVLDMFFDGKKDEKTLQLINRK